MNSKIRISMSIKAWAPLLPTCTDLRRREICVRSKNSGHSNPGPGTSGFCGFHHTNPRHALFFCPFQFPPYDLLHNSAIFKNVFPFYQETSKFSLNTFAEEIAA